MKKTELLLGLIILIAEILFFLHVSWSGVLLSLAILVLSFFYYAFSFALFNEIKFNQILQKQSYQAIKRAHLFYSIVIGWALSVLLIGLLFYLEKLPYAEYILAAGGISVLIFLLAGIFLYFKTKIRFYKNIIFRLFVVCLIATATVFIL